MDHRDDARALAGTMTALMIGQFASIELVPETN